GFNQSIIDPIFARLKTELPHRINDILSQQTSDPILEITGNFPIDQQRQLGLELMQALGFNFNHGRLDVSHHPFCGGVPSDVRITTRYNESEFITSVMAVCHETGHARYEQGLPVAWRSQPVGKALGMAIHESQSLLIEMYACRSAAFMQFLSPLIKRHFGDQPYYNPANLLKHYTRVKPGFIRVDADALTYPLHVILRYELEQQLFNDQLTIKDLPDAWNQKMQQYLGLSTVNNYKDGVMQDVHWPAGLFGYFPSYTLGSLIAAQLFAAALKQHPTIETQLSQGDFTTLFSWLNQHVHSRGSSVSPATLLQDATGSALDPSFYLKHISR
nr:carboxypeptidase M32 [Pseudomonadota bacterium]